MFKTMLILALMFSLPAFAKKKGGGGSQGGGGNKNPACDTIRAACEKAGYKGRVAIPGTAGSVRDCLHNWNSGAAIPGSTIKPSDAAGKECSGYLTKMKARRGGPAVIGGKPGRRRGGIMEMGGSRPPSKPSPLLRNPPPPTPMGGNNATTPPPVAPAPARPAVPAATPPPKKP